jgi:hypothetical protein
MKTPFKMKYNTSPIKQKLNSPLKQLPPWVVLGFNPGEDYLREATGQPPKQTTNITKVYDAAFKIENFKNTGETKFMNNESNYQMLLEEHNNFMQDLESGTHGKKPKNWKGSHSQWLQHKEDKSSKYHMTNIKRNIT